jgi:anti-sigma B factor antagonist
MSPSTSPRDGKPDRCPVCGTGVGGGSSDVSGKAPCPNCGHLLWFVSSRVGSVTVIHLIDTRAAVMELIDLLDNAVLEGAFGQILINFGKIQQVSSAALGKLIKLMSHADSVRGKLKLCSLHEDLRHVFRITRLDQVFEIYDQEAEALASFIACPSVP